MDLDTDCPEFGVGCPETLLGPCCTLDADNDGYAAASCGGPDCRDDRADVNPGMNEGDPSSTCTDDVDNDCDTVENCNEPSCSIDPSVCPTPTPTPTPTPAPGTPNVIFMASADHESTIGEKQIGNTNLVIASGIAGAHGRVYDTDDALFERLVPTWQSPSLQTTLGARMRFRPHGAPQGAGVITFRDDSPYAQSVVRVHANGSIQVFRGGGSETITSPSATGLVSADTWYWIEATTFIDNTAGTFRVRLWNGDGTTLLADMSGSGDTQYTASAGATNIQFGWTQSSGTYVDDLSIDTTQSLLGPSRVEVLYPDAQGDFQQFMRGGTDTLANFSQVNETIKNLTSYATSSQAEEFDFYNIGPRVISGTPKAIQVWTIMQRKTAGTDPVEFVVAVLTNGVGFHGKVTFSSGGATVRGKGECWSYNPATGLAWSDADINSLQIGVHSFSENVRLHQVVAEVLVQQSGE